MIKYYRKKGTKEATHETQSYRDSLYLREIGSCSTCVETSDPRQVLQFLEANNFEEVPEVKLPEVGKRYKSDFCQIRQFLVDKEEGGIVYGYWDGELILVKFFLNYFLEHFEELPNQEEIKESMGDSKTISHQVYIKNDPNPLNYTASYTVPIGGKLESKLHYGERVEKAKEELRGEYSTRILPFRSMNHNDGEAWYSCYRDLREKAQNLLEALEELKIRTVPIKLYPADVFDAMKETKEPEAQEKHYSKTICPVCNIEIGYSETGFDLSKMKWYHLDKCYDARNKDVEGKPLTEERAQEIMKELDKEYKDKLWKDFTQPKSIWKDVSELPKQDCDVVLRMKNGVCRFGSFLEGNQMFIPNDGGCLNWSKKFIKEYCTLTDYINDQEQFKQYVLGRLNKEGK